ncbi:Uncharacterised protein [Mycobacterium tuberculosis]|nr:Uncharacterised protein [Mycobacterium tuberculosis]
MTANILPSLRPVEVRQLTLQVNALTDGGIGLQIQAIPQFALADKDERHGTLRIHLEVQQETHFLQHLTIQEMRLVDDHNGLQPVNAAHELDFAVQLPLGVAAVELRLAAELLEQPFVEVPRRQLGIRYIEHFEFRGV